MLQEFGFCVLDLTESDFIKLGNVIQLGCPSLRIDLLTRLDGVVFTACYAKRLDVEHDGLLIYVIGLDDFIKNKAALSLREVGYFKT